MSEHQKKVYIEVSDCLKYLEDAGWSLLIDSRWENVIIEELRNNYPNITDEVLNKTLELVLV